MAERMLRINDEEIPLVIRTYKTSKNIKAYFKENVLYISKPRYVPLKEIDLFIKKYEDYFFNEYIKIKSNKKFCMKNFENNDEIYYKGTAYKIISSENVSKKAEIKINEDEKVFIISTPIGLDEKIRRDTILKLIKKIFKNNTECIISERLNYWSDITKINYNTFKVHDAKTRYGSCIKTKKALNFSSRLIMLPMDKIDAIIVHELCHIEEANHSPKFYSLVESFIPNYKEIDKWLKKNGNILNL